MYYVKETVKDLYRVGCKQGRLGCLRLDMNENPKGLPKDFVDEVKREITPEFLSTYPEPEKLASLTAEFLHVDYENICLTNGSDEAIRFIFEIFARQGSEVVSISPTFEMYKVYCEMFGLCHKPVPYSENFEIQITDILEAIGKDTDIVVALNPNNPIGTVFSEDDMEHIIQRAQQAGAVVIIDEAYHYFYNKTFLPLAMKYNNVILLRTFSKLFSLAACRLGFAVANPELIQYLKKVRPSFNVNAVALKFGEKILEHPELIDKLIAAEEEGKAVLKAGLKKQGYQVYAYEGNFLFFKPRLKPQVLAKKLEEQKILVKTFGYELLKDFIRVTTGDKETMDYFLSILEKTDKE